MFVARYISGVTRVGRDLEEAIAQLLLRRNRARLVEAALSAAPTAVDVHTYPVLSGLSRIGPATAARLSGEIGIDRSGASRHADRLVQAGLLRREPDPSDARGTLLVLTPAGEEAVAGMRAALAHHLDAKIETWPPGLAEAVVDGLRRLAADQGAS